MLRGDLCVEIVGSGSFEFSAATPLVMAPGVTLEIRAASGSWPLIRIRSGVTQICGKPWTVRMHNGCSLILDGLQICGATLMMVDAHEANSVSVPNGCDREVIPPSTDQESADYCSLPGVDAQSRHEQQTAASLIVRHTTFVPGGRSEAISCRCEPNHASIATRLSLGRLVISHSIVGTLNIEHPHSSSDGEGSANCPCPLNPLAVYITDSIVDHALGRPAVTGECCWPAHAEVTIERSTVLGDICVQQIRRAADSIFTGIVHVQRRGIGSMRYCYLPIQEDLADSSLVDRSGWERWLRSTSKIAEGGQVDCCSLIRTPVRYQCQPSQVSSIAVDVECVQGCVPQSRSAIVEAPLRQFVSTTYGALGYCELKLQASSSIRRGAEDESEPGVFHDLYSPHRAAALESLLQEYTPAEIDSAVIYADDLLLPHLATAVCRPCRTT